jgi:hypothetical protein
VARGWCSKPLPALPLLLLQVSHGLCTKWSCSCFTSDKQQAGLLLQRAALCCSFGACFCPVSEHMGLSGSIRASVVADGVSGAPLVLQLKVLHDLVNCPLPGVGSLQLK